MQGFDVISEPDKQVTRVLSFSRICSVCFSSIGPSSSHECCSSTAVSNLIILAFTLGSLQADQVASGILKKRIEDENIKKGSQFKLSTGGNPMMISLGCADNKTERRSVKQISFQLIKELQIVLELSLNKTKQLVSVLRKGMESQLAVESNILRKLKDLELTISNYYQVEKVFNIAKFSINKYLPLFLIFVSLTLTF